MRSKQYILYLIEPYRCDVLMVSWVILSHSLVIVLSVFFFCIRFDTCSSVSNMSKERSYLSSMVVIFIRSRIMD